MESKIFLIIVLIELSVILILGIKAYTKNRNILGTTSFNPINKDSLFFQDTGHLKYFYEPQSNIIDEENIVGFEDKKSHYTINSDSLNERFDYITDKSNDGFRIITLGDSWTFGMFVDTNDNYPEQLEDLLQNLNCEKVKKIEVINLGVTGYDIQYSVERFKIRGSKYSPDLILWLLKDDDFTQIEEFIHPLVEKYKKMGYPMFDDKNKDWPAIKNAVDEYNSIYGEQNILNYQKGFLYSIRNYTSVPIILLTNTGNSKYLQLIDEVIKSSQNIYHYDIGGLLNKEEYSYIDKHPTKEGYKVISQHLLNYLVTNKFIPCH